MTNAAVADQLPMSNTLHFGGAAARGGGSKKSTTNLKRKTPSELRGELLKQKNILELSDEVTSSMRNADGVVSGPKMADSSKALRFTRMGEHYSVTKTSRLLCRKENHKENISSNSVDKLNNSSIRLGLLAKHQAQNSCLDDGVASKGGKNQTDNSSETSTTGTFKSVRELSLGGGMSNNSLSVDMGKALRGLVSCEPHAASAPLAESIDKMGNIRSKSFCSEIHVPGHKVPLDLTLKTTMRLQSSSSVNWFHRLINGFTLNDMGLFMYGSCQDQSMDSSKPTSSCQLTNHGIFHSWVHPQSTLPHAAISALSSVPEGQMDFLSKRQQAWQDSFRNLYYMLRKKLCKIFYVCTMQFVVMFTIYDGPNKTRGSCHAYVSQSTRNLRSLLKENDVSFTMPLCHSKVEEVTAEDLVELSEIEKHNLGKTRAMESIAGVDNTPQSLLMVAGNNVHALYDFLLNYRSFYSPLSGNDVPVLYSPVPFENAALSAPEIKCKQVRRVDHGSFQLKDSIMDLEPNSTSAGICNSVEIMDTYLPPWVISGICDVMRSKGRDFQASFVIEPSSIGLNVGLEISAGQGGEQSETENGHPFGIPNTTLSLHKHNGYIKGLKYADTSYTAFLSPAD
ncbi:hypothetical protein ACS0TY_015750 [Phlomoides rotata]